MGWARKIVTVYFSLILLIMTVSIGVEAQSVLFPEGERNDSPESARVINYGEPLLGKMVENDEDWFSFVANRGDTIKMGFLPYFEYRYKFVAPNGKTINTRYQGDIHRFEAPESGEYLFSLKYAPAINSDLKRSQEYTGKYVLILDKSESDVPTDDNEYNDARKDSTIVPENGVVHGVLESGDKDWYTFGAARGENIRIYSMHGPYAGWWLLVDNKGQRIDMDFTDYTASATAPTTGQYYIRYRYDQDWLKNRDNPSRWRGELGEYYILFDFDVRSIESVQKDTESDVPDDKDTNGEEIVEDDPPDPPPDNTPDYDVGAIIAAAIAGLATIIAAFLKRG